MNKFASDADGYFWAQLQSEEASWQGIEGNRRVPISTKMFYHMIKYHLNHLKISCHSNIIQIIIKFVITTVCCEMICNTKKRGENYIRVGFKRIFDF